MQELMLQTDAATTERLLAAVAKGRTRVDALMTRYETAITTDADQALYASLRDRVAIYRAAQVGAGCLGVSGTETSIVDDRTATMAMAGIESPQTATWILSLVGARY